MTYQTISLTLVSPLSAVDADDEPTADDIDQVPIPEAPDGGYNGWLQEQGLQSTPENLAKYNDTYKPWCNEDGSLAIKFNSAKDPASLKASYGDLSPGQAEISEHNETKTVANAESLDLGGNIIGTVVASWDGPVLAEDGATIFPQPAISVSGSVISWGVKVNGTLRLRYAEEHTTYTLTITPRSDVDAGDKDAAYQSTIYVTDENGKTTTKEVDLPDMSGACPGDAGFGDTPSDDDDAQCVRHNIEVNPCTGEILREWDEPMDCPEVQLANCRQKCSEGEVSKKEDCLKACEGQTYGG